MASFCDRRLARLHLPALVCLAALAGCNSHTEVDVTGSAPATATHLWVTVEEVWFAAAADTPPESQTGWTRKTLSTPVVFDLGNLGGASTVSLAKSLAIPAGNYRQMHLVLADSTDRLVGAARAAGLDYNAQVEFTDAGTGAAKTAPLELPVPGVGLTIPIDLTFRGSTTASSTTGSSSGTTTSGSGTASVTSLVATLDAGRDVSSYAYGADTGYLLSPSASVHETNSAGAISGTVDASGLAADHPPITVSAEKLDSTRTHHAVVSRRPVAADGSFTLYPLPASKQGSTEYDVVISCAGADTVVVRNVSVKAGAASSPVALQSTPIVLTPARTVYVDLGAQSPALPAGTRVEFYETLPGASEVPYVVDGTAVDPLTRRLPDGAFALASGSVVVGTYATGSAISFDTSTAAEGKGGYRVGTSGPYRSDTLGAETVVVKGSSTSSPTLATAPLPTIAAGGKSGTLTVTVQVPAGRFDAGFVTIGAGNRLIETASVGPLLLKGGGTVIVPGLPAGSALAPTSGVPYQVALRAWNSSDAPGTITRVAAANSVTLGDLGTAAVTLQVQ